MCKPDGVPIELNGKRFRRRFGTRSDELSEREVAGMMTREIRLELRRGSYFPLAGFRGPIPYPRGSERGPAVFGLPVSRLIITNHFADPGRSQIGSVPSPSR